MWLDRPWQHWILTFIRHIYADLQALSREFIGERPAFTQAVRRLLERPESAREAAGIQERILWEGAALNATKAALSPLEGGQVGLLSGARVSARQVWRAQSSDKSDLMQEAGMAARFAVTHVLSLPVLASRAPEAVLAAISSPDLLSQCIQEAALMAGAGVGSYKASINQVRSWQICCCRCREPQ